MNPEIAVLSDFDGTITRVNVLNHLYARFAAPSHRSLVERWNRGEISIQQELEGCFATIEAGRAEMESVLDSISLDPGFPSFLKFCQEKGIVFAVVSDGLRWYIEYIFKRYKLEPVPIYANEILFEKGGYRFSYPWFDPVTPMGGTSKLAITRRYQTQGYRVVFIGDGLNDIEAACEADLVFARDFLLEYTCSHGIEALEFENFETITTELQTRF